MRTLNYKTDFCVVGGGLAGLCAAISAARHGIKVVLVQDRPMLGGNSSSEIRMWVCGSHGKDNRETGIVEELFLENFYQNPGNKFTLWDLVLYEKAMAEENLTLLLNSSVLDAQCEDRQIKTVKAWQSCAETFHVISAKYFADCSGDSILVPLSGAEYRYGREGREEFGESIAPVVADKKTMGMSCLFQIRETDSKKEFIPPAWAYKYESDDDLPYKDHSRGCNFWWIELGGEWDCIHDTDRCREELIKICLGVWDHMKNYGDHGVDNWELEWIGFLPGKRESRRYVGEYIVNQNDVERGGRFHDLVAYAGWSMDDHFPEGFYYTKGDPTIFHPAPQPWGLPMRCMISKNIKNLVFAGRNISATHTAMSSSRVMATCGILGQALGTGVAQALNNGQDIREIDIRQLQNTLMNDDCYLPWHNRQVSELSLKAKCNADIVRNGMDRGDENCWIGEDGDYIEYEFDKEEQVQEIRLVFDSNINRPEHNMPCRHLINEPDYKVPQTLVKVYTVMGISENGEETKISIVDNHQRFVRHKVDWNVKKVRIIPKETYGHEKYRIFSAEVK